MDTKRHEKLQNDLKKIIEEFEAETGFMVDKIELRRRSATALLALSLWGLYIPVIPKGQVNV